MNIHSFKLKIIGALSALCIAAGLITTAVNAKLTLSATVLLILGLGALFAFVVRNLDAVKELLFSRGARYRGGASVTTVLVIVVLGLVNYLATRHSFRIDTTVSGTYSLAPQTIAVLKNLTQDITLRAFVESGQKKIIGDMMTEYRYYSKHIKVHYYNLNEQPALASRYGVTTAGTIIFEYDMRTEKIEELPSEELFTNAILKVLREGITTVCFVEGHGEKDLTQEGDAGYMGIKKALEASGYAVRSISLLHEGAVPKDCDVLIIAGPQQALVKGEQEQVAHYLDNGGAALLLVDPEKVSLAHVVAPWQITVGEDILVDVNPAAQYFGASEFMPIVTKYEPHTITKGFRVASIFPLVRSVSVSKTRMEGITAVPLVFTSKQSWADSEPSNESVKYDAKKDVKGPISMAVAVESKRSARKDSDEITFEEAQSDPLTRLVVVGDSDFGANSYLKFPGNRDLFLNMVAWLATEDNHISIRPKNQQDRQVFLTLKQSRVVFWFVVIIWPFALILVGVWVWINRRK